MPRINWATVRAIKVTAKPTILHNIIRLDFLIFSSSPAASAYITPPYIRSTVAITAVALISIVAIFRITSVIFVYELTADGGAEVHPIVGSAIVPSEQGIS